MQKKKAFSTRAIWRSALPVVVSLCLLWSFGPGLLTFDVATILQTVRQFPPGHWALAAGLTVISFAAVAQYDRIVAAWLDLDLPRKAVLHAGWRATAISQVLGYGLVTGALIRWRALGGIGLSLWDCSRLTALASVAFFTGWVVVTSIVLILTDMTAAANLPQAALLVGMATTLAVGVLCVHPPSRLARHIPGLNSYVGAILFTAVDTVTAAAVIYVFLPDGYVPFLPFYAMFLLAFSAGMLSGLPGGLGAFEVTLVALLAPTDQAPLLSAILAYRLIYYATPAVIAAATLIWPQSRATPTARLETSVMVPHDMALFAPPEVDLTTQGQLKITRSLGAFGTAALNCRARHADFLLGDPFGTGDMSIQPYLEASQRAGKALCLYKIGPSVAELAKASGLFTFCIGSEAIIAPHAFNTEGVAFRQLRRKLKRAEKGGVTITDIPPPYEVLASLDRAWQNANGQARGFSMGRLSPSLLNRQRVFTAECDGVPIAFLTLLIGADRWTLDLMRIGDGAPDGTMHALVAAALREAKAEHVPEFSLAAAPMRLPKAPCGCAERLVDFAYRKTPQLRGLAQFKTSFNPTWEPRFLAIDRPWILPLALHDLWFLINRPEAGTINEQGPHNDYALYEFDSLPQPCHALERMT